MKKTALLLNSIDNLNSVDDRAAEAGQLSKKIDSIVNLIRDYEVFAALKTQLDYSSRKCYLSQPL
ncbi:MAG: hypothetical protein HWD59_03925 [Coxiellaceae bacterium]|nr:MAG: hypothetical protein HWD59_03925 [Coxiellaceae bacterium]